MTTSAVSRIGAVLLVWASVAAAQSASNQASSPDWRPVQQLPAGRLLTVADDADVFRGWFIGASPHTVTVLVPPQSAPKAVADRCEAWARQSPWAVARVKDGQPLTSKGVRLGPDGLFLDGKLSRRSSR